MIVILEGLNGTGKSTYAGLLEAELGLTRCRPFRGGDHSLHWGAEKGAERELLTQLQGYGVPVNTHVDDLYVADFLRTFKVGAILDRSLPSAIAYGTVTALNPDADVLGMLKYWQELIREASARVLYVWLTAQHSVAKRRAAGRWCPNKAKYTYLEGVFGHTFHQVNRLAKMRIDTAEVELKDGVRRICQALKI